jgi:hypothetical protein
MGLLHVAWSIEAMAAGGRRRYWWAKSDGRYTFLVRSVTSDGRRRTVVNKTDSVLVLPPLRY